LEEWKKRDPIKLFKERLVNSGIATEDEIAQIEKKIEEEVEEAVKFAEESPYPNPEETLEDVYA